MEARRLNTGIIAASSRRMFGCGLRRGAAQDGLAATVTGDEFHQPSNVAGLSYDAGPGGAMKAVIASVSAIVVLTTGCASEDPAPAPAATEQSARTESAIEGVPLPPTAKLHPSEKPLRQDLKTETYWAVGMSFDELDAWYEQRMPKGKPWNGWRWQEPIAGRTYVARDYCHEKRDGISVTLIRKDSGNPPGIFITQDGSGSGCKSQP